jgi:IclR family pca regulon transcriptional regulator
MTVSINVGSRMPAHLTALGRVLLADLPEHEFADYLAAFRRAYPAAAKRKDEAALRRAIAQARDAGWASVDQELEEGLLGIAAPVRDGTGRVIVAAGISTHAARRNLQSLQDDLVPALLATVRNIEAARHPVA